MELYHTLKLNTGETIIGVLEDYVKGDRMFNVCNPVRVLETFTGEKIEYELVPWMPYSDTNTITVYEHSVAAISGVSAVYLALYQDAAAEYSEPMLEDVVPEAAPKDPDWFDVAQRVCTHRWHLGKQEVHRRPEQDHNHKQQNDTDCNPQKDHDDGDPGQLSEDTPDAPFRL